MIRTVISISSLCILSALSTESCAFGIGKQKTDDQAQSRNETAPSKTVVPQAREWKFYLETARRQYQQGDVRAAATNLDLALAGCERLRDGARAEAMGTIADEYMQLGNYPKAASLLEECVKTKRRIPLLKGAATAASLDHLAQAYARTGRLEEADKLSAEALDIFKSDQEKKPTDYAIALANRAYVLRMFKRYDQAEKLLTEAVEIQEKSGSDKLELAKTLINLGGVLCDDGRLNEAAKPIEKAQLMIQEKLPNNHSLFKLSIKAQRVLAKRRVDALLREDANIYRAEVGKALSDLGALYLLEGDTTQALETYRQTLNVYEKTSASKGQEVTAAIDKCVECLERIGDQKEAALLAERARVLKLQQ